MKLDPYNHERLHNKWKENQDHPNLCKATNKILQDYISDMELGRNISRHSPKGRRSYIRLNKLRQKVFYVVELLKEQEGVADISKTTEKQVHQLFDDMRTGKIRKLNGGIYKSTWDYVKNFKSFWHWFMKINSQKGKPIIDITLDLDSRMDDLPTFNYFDQDQFNEMLKVADADMKVLMLFLMDTGIRVTEMKNVKVSDFLNDFKELNIREETAKTFGRRIKLMMSGETIKNYVKQMEIKTESYLFSLDVKVMNNRLKTIGQKVLKQPNLSLYDFRHSSACYWYPRYKDVKAYLYRFGWKKLEMAHYYSRFLGMEDTITEEDLMLGVTKSELERDMEKLKLKQEQEMQQIHQVLKNVMDQFAKNSKPIETGSDQWVEAIGSYPPLRHLIKEQ